MFRNVNNVFSSASRRLYSWGSGPRLLQSIDCHSSMSARVIVGGVPHVPGDTVFEKRKYMMDNMDDLRKLLMLEPRGFPTQNVNVILPPSDSRAKFGYVIMEQNKIYPLMSGHNTICVATALLESGMIPMEEPITKFTLEAPGGLIHIQARCKNGKAEEITFLGTPSWLEKKDVVVDVPELGKVVVDIAYGGMWFTIVNAEAVGVKLSPENGKEICRVGEMIKIASREQHPVNHPEYDYPGSDIIVMRGPAINPTSHAGNAVVMSNGILDWNKPDTWTGMLDRSPCGTGTCAVMASLFSRGKLSLNEEFNHDSILGTTFKGKLIEETIVGDGISAVIPQVSGQAWITSYTSVVCDPSDPFPSGYTVGDIWTS